MHRRKPKILLINFVGMGIGSSGLLAAEALSRNPNLEVRFIYNRGARESGLHRSRLEKIPGLGVSIRSRKDLPLAYLKTLFDCLKFRPDVVHDLSGSAYRRNLPLWPVLALLSRLVFSEHAPSKDRLRLFSNRLARRLAYRLGKKFVVFGPSSRAAMLHCGVAGQKIFQSRLGHKGLYAEALEDKLRRDPNTILVFGEMRPGKGTDLLLPIAEAVHARCPAARFLVVGSSESARHFGTAWARQLEACLNEMRARPYFDVRDEFVPDEQLAYCFGSAGMVLLPYREANQSGILLTAMALGCPVVATAIGDLPSVIRHGENGILCPADVAALADAILSLLGDPQRAAMLAARAKQDADGEFDWEKIVREYPGEVYGLCPPIQNGACQT